VQAAGMPLGCDGRPTGVATGSRWFAIIQAIFQQPSLSTRLPVMAYRKDIDSILRNWPFEPGEVMARLVRASDGRQVLQMRVDMGILQLEVDKRPDGSRPHGAETYFDYLLAEAIHQGDDFQLSPEQCTEADREFVQFYHRRICWLALKEYRRAVRDADHSLAFMDFVKRHSPDEEWTLSHEQYRPFVLFHRVQAAALAALEEHGPEEAIAEVNEGLRRFHEMFEEYEISERFESDELVGRLMDLKEALRDHYALGKTLDEQLAEAVAAEDYELAAKLRDEMARRAKQPPRGR
jgi:hypothetical protein